MGEQDVKSNLEGQELRRFMKRLLVEVSVLEKMLAEGWIESGITRIGAEQELFLVDRSRRPAMLGMEFLETLGDPHYTTELGRFNVEFNLDPLVFGDDCLSRLERDIDEHLVRGRATAQQLGIDIVMAGILPTLTLSDLTVDAIAPMERYYALNEAMCKLRGGAFEFRFHGTDELIVKHDNVMLEACNTSFQVHFQVSRDDFTHFYNIAQFLSGPVLAAAVNSPLLFGQRLWQETRIGLFQQAVDTRKSSHQVQERLARVSFGTDWVQGSVTDILKEDIARFRVILGIEIDDDPWADFAAGKPPSLKALRLHNGTVYRWNRPCYGIGGGKAHLRIENRYIPAGPTPADEVANAAFWFGLMKYYTDEFDDITSVFRFDDAKSNFLSAAREGLNARLVWLDGTDTSSPELILLRLLPEARQGLARAGIVQADIDRYLGIIEARVASGRTGARWALESFSKMKAAGGRGDRRTALVQAMIRNQQTGAPVHEWPLAEIGDAGDKFDVHRRVSSLMTTDVFTVNRNEVIDLVACMMDWKHIRHVPVEDDDENLVGLVSYRTLIRMLSKDLPGGSDRAIPVHEVMSEPITIDPDTPIIDAIHLMRERKISCLPVARNGKLVGIVTDHDFLDLAAELFEEKIAAQRAAGGGVAAKPGSEGHA